MAGSPGVIADLAGQISPVDGGKPSTGNFGYTPTAPTNTGRYSAQYATPTASPFLQSVLQQNSSPSLMSGLAGLSDMSGMANLYNSYMPQQNSGLQQLTPMQPYLYRPNMTMAQQNLNNVAPSVALQQQRDAEAEAARRAAEAAAGGGE